MQKLYKFPQGVTTFPLKKVRAGVFNSSNTQTLVEW